VTGLPSLREPLAAGEPTAMEALADPEEVDENPRI